MLDEAQRQTRLAKTGSAGEEDEVRRLQAAGLLVERLHPGRHTKARTVTALLDLRDVAVERHLERHDVPMERCLAHREEQTRCVLDRAASILADEREARELVRRAHEIPQRRGARN